ncbi:hypothetical protein [Salisediminibacterium halotolerans]|uniref:Uncharacterized protein n=1 Tax=Salisediminibacterium halotolerans TaxID=517425 RepID=A0A1H9QW91_9BACI|nr:hypothetical protein [Salisediminibacterium haloalkalitolerans]SER64515.1 hypothetical protein SAMN05444126_103152 [Salisediminibacterium haloalkalitolerans]
MPRKWKFTLLIAGLFMMNFMVITIYQTADSSSADAEEPIHEYKQEELEGEFRQNDLLDARQYDNYYLALFDHGEEVTIAGFQNGIFGWIHDTEKVVDRDGPEFIHHERASLYYGVIPETDSGTPVLAGNETDVVDLSDESAVWIYYDEDPSDSAYTPEELTWN